MGVRITSLRYEGISERTWCAVLRLDTVGYVKNYATRLSEKSSDREPRSTIIQNERANSAKAMFARGGSLATTLCAERDKGSIGVMPIIAFLSVLLKWSLHPSGPQDPAGSIAVGYGRELLIVNTV